MLDPEPISMSGWVDISSLLLYLGIYIIFIATFAFSILVGVAVIPSLVSTGHIPRQALKVLPLAVGFGIVALMAAGSFLGLVVVGYQDLDDFFPRWWL